MAGTPNPRHFLYGWFINIIRKYVKNKLEKNNFKSPELLLNKNRRKFLEKRLRKYKEKLEVLKAEIHKHEG